MKDFEFKIIVVYLCGTSGGRKSEMNMFATKKMKDFEFKIRARGGYPERRYLIQGRVGFGVALSHSLCLFSFLFVLGVIRVMGGWRITQQFRILF